MYEDTRARCREPFGELGSVDVFDVEGGVGPVDVRVALFGGERDG